MGGAVASEKPGGERGDERHREQRDQPDYIVCNQANGVLAYDPDGDAIAFALLVKSPCWRPMISL